MTPTRKGALRMDSRSETNLAQVHPDLAKVMRLAAPASKVPFIVIHGLRSAAEEAAMVAKGASTTLHSRHLASTDGLARVVDVMADPAGAADWRPVDYQAIAAAVFAAAHSAGTPVEWGGAWTTFKDWGHFQLPWSIYP